MAAFGHLFMVADGMGGHAVGDLASRITVETAAFAYFKCDAPTLRNRCIGDSVQRTKRSMIARVRTVNSKAWEQPAASLALLTEGAIVGHVGDSRVYRVRVGGSNN
jgi:serine/threonine protein phosphatase PrpC